VPAAPSGADEYAKSAKIELLLFKQDINKSLWKLEGYLNEISGILRVSSFEKSLSYSSSSAGDGKFPRTELCCLLRWLADQRGRDGVNQRKRLPATSGPLPLRNRIGYFFTRGYTERR
jgi:hypothetical protein